MKTPGFLFNIGQCHRNLNNYDKALFSFKQFLRAKPDTNKREAVEKLIEQWKQQKAEQERIKREEKERERKRKEKEAQQRELDKKLQLQMLSQKNDTPPPPSTPFYKSWWFWVPVVAVAVAGGAVGTYFALRPTEAQMPPANFPAWDLSR